MNGLNQYSSIGGVSYQYDASGNLTSDGDNTYVYDVENRLRQVSGVNNATMTYDPLGRLVQVSGSSTTRFFYDGDAMIAEYSASNVTGFDEDFGLIEEFHRRVSWVS